MGWLNEIIGKKKSAAPAVPKGRCVFAVGDIHGRCDLLRDILDRIRECSEPAGNTLVFLGDYVDRGPDSRGVLDVLTGLDWPGWEFVALRGNHEALLLAFLEDSGLYLSLRSFGIAETLVSYGVAPPASLTAEDFARVRDAFAASLPLTHRTFLSSLRPSYSLGDYFFAHAGVRPGVTLERQTSDGLLWIRDDFLSSNRSFGKIVVHGHTPGDEPVIRKNRIGIDTGAYATNRLTAIKLVGTERMFLSTGSSMA